jgi:hypothetical protein
MCTFENEIGKKVKNGEFEKVSSLMCGLTDHAIIQFAHCNHREKNTYFIITDQLMIIVLISQQIIKLQITVLMRCYTCR